MNFKYFMFGGFMAALGLAFYLAVNTDKNKGTRDETRNPCTFRAGQSQLLECVQPGQCVYCYKSQHTMRCTTFDPAGCPMLPWPGHGHDHPRDPGR